jgi:hypothetical protein
MTVYHAEIDAMIEKHRQERADLEARFDAIQALHDAMIEARQRWSDCLLKEKPITEDDEEHIRWGIKKSRLYKPFKAASDAYENACHDFFLNVWRR